MTKQPDLTLYHAHHSTCSQKVRICLAEKGLNWRGVLVNLATKEHLSGDYLAINPNGVVPTLVHDGEVVLDSSVICEYLDEVFPEPRLTPAAPAARAAMRAWMRYIEEVPTVAVRYPSFNMAFLPRFNGLSEQEFHNQQSDIRPLRKEFYRTMGPSGFTESEIRAAFDDTRKTIERMDAALARGDWLIGDIYTLADIVLAPLVDRMADLGFEELWRGHPRVGAWFDRVKQRAAFRDTFYAGTRLSELHDLAPAYKSESPQDKAAQ